jgi:hypothetical protein
VFSGCPGQDRRFWKPSDVSYTPCGHCGESVEFFRSDVTLPCPSCRRPVANPSFDSGCAAWCDHAAKCLAPTLAYQRQARGRAAATGGRAVES